MRSRPIGALGQATLLCLLGACASDRGPGVTDATKTPPPKTPDRERIAMRVPTEPGLAFTVEDADPEAEASAKLPRAKTQPLGASEAKRLLARLEPLEADPNDVVGFRLRKGSRPAPKTGETVETAFPPPAPPADAPTTTTKPLTVLRMQPEGDVHTVPRVSVTFDQPMVPISGVADVDALPRPVTLDPEPPGQWRWVGSQTVVFEPKTRMPMATDYTVSVVPGTKSAIGGALAEPERYAFSTPAPSVTRWWPSGKQVDVRPVIGLTFDQAVDPQAVLPLLSLKAGKTTLGLRLASETEIEADAPSARVAKSEVDAPRTVFLVADAALPTDTKIVILAKAGVPSAEGKKTSKKAQSHDFRTYPPLKIEEVNCGWGGDCRPLQPWSVRFNNTLDPERVTLEHITVEPEVPGLDLDVGGNHLSLRGLTKGRTKYTITFSPEITDRFGQKLGETKAHTLKVGEAQPALMLNGGAMTVLDPAGPRALSVHLVNYPKLEVKIWKVSPKDWPAYLDWQRSRKGQRPPGKKVFDETVKTGAPQDSLHEFRLDLSPALDGDFGHAVVEITPPTSLLTGWMKDNPPKHRQWLQSTKLAIDAFVDADEALTWVTRLEDGKPKGGLTVDMAPAGQSGTTEGDGLARLELPSSSGHDKARLVVTDGADTAFLPESEWRNRGTSWSKRTLPDQTRWFTFDDRSLYKPGETVRVKGWMRRLSTGPKSDVIGPPAGAKLIRYKVYDPRGNELSKGRAKISTYGGFDVAFDLPDDANLGWATVQFETSAGDLGELRHGHRFQIQEFRRPEFEVSAFGSDGPHVLGDAPVFTVEAKYYAGGGLAGAPVDWRFTASPGHYSPPGHDEYTFGFARPWWWWPSPNDDQGATRRSNHKGTTDATGVHRVRAPLEGASPPRTYVLKADASVSDVNRQVWSAHHEVVVHPADIYVGLKPTRTFVGKGDPVVISHLVSNLEGELVAARDLEIVAERMVYKRIGGKYQEVPADKLTCAAKSGAEAGECKFEPEMGGRYRIRASAKDAIDRETVTELTVWVGGSESPPSRNVEEEPVRLVPNQDTYAVGDVAEILVLAPFADAEGLMTLRREGLLATERFTIEGTSHVLKIPITEGHLPKLHLAVELAGAAPRTDDRGEAKADLPTRPAHAAGHIDLRVPPVTRSLTVDARPAKAALSPGEQTEVTVTVTGADGRPADAEVTVIVVDEAVLAIAGYSLNDPIETFYFTRSPGVQTHRLRREVVLGRPDDVGALAQAAEGEADGAFGAVGGAPGGGGMAPPAPMMKMARSRSMAADAEAAPAEPDAPIAVRSDFSALAHFAPAVQTGKDGRAVVEVKLPDNLTRYRVMAVAVDASRRFGKGEGQIVARLPLMVRPSPPRFLSYGDRFELPVVLQNQTDAAMSVQVALRSTNLGLGGTRAYLAQVPANDRVEVRFEAEAEKPGTARFQVGAAAGAAADAATGDFPVYTPATTEAFATYGTITKGAVRQPVKRPADAVTAFGGLEVSTASTQLQALTDAFIYLLEYPYGCAEQVASRVLSIAALKDVLAAFEAPGLPDEKKLLAAVGRDLEKLSRLQNGDGGWGFWRRGRPSWPYVSVHVLHALARAEAEGFSVKDATMRRGAGYLKRIERYIPRDYPPAARRTIEAYALYVRALRGDLDGKRAQALLSEAGGVKAAPLELLGWLYPVFIDSPEGRKVLPQIRKHLNNRATEEAGTAHFVTSYSEGAHLLLHSNRRVDGLLLEGLLKDQPKLDLVPKIARGLLAHKTKGRWGNTQENAWVLLALHRYFKTYEKVTPNFVARVWLGDVYAGDHKFKGRTTETHLVRVPMADVPAKAAEDLIIQNDGQGRLYYRIGMSYAPTDLELEPSERGFSVERSYAAVDDPDDVQRGSDGTWVVKAGTRVRVTLKMVAPTRRYHVALVDKLPAGFEPLNPALVGTEPIPAAAEAEISARRGYWWWYRPWYEHENLRDERVEAFSTLVWAGVHEYSYVARATTPGHFVAPPAKAEEMYSPEVFGRSGTAKVRVK